MQNGFFAVGIGPSADPELLALAARATGQCEFHSLWTDEHVVLVSQHASKYPYTQDGRMPLPTTCWLASASWSQEFLAQRC